MSEEGGEGSGRLRREPSKALLDTAYARELRTAGWLAEAMALADLAHLAMLARAGIVDADRGVKLLEALLDDKEDEGTWDWDPRWGDVYTNRERRLRQKHGDLAGMLRLGRARREAVTVSWYLEMREALSSLQRAALGLAGTLLALAGEHRAALMVDFTYLQHAQPTTLGHYLLSFLPPVLRDVSRLQASFDDFNLCPGGFGSVNGSQLNLDRAYLADLLGFRGFVPHTRDAMWQCDVPIAALSAVLSLMTTCGRLADDLQVWATEEFGFVQLDDAHCRTSAIMPQKKNPYSLCFIRGFSRHLLGRFVGVAASFHSTTGQPDNRLFAYEELPAAAREAEKVCTLLAEVLDRCTFNREALRRSAQAGCSVATDLAELLSVRLGLDYHAAHRIVGELVRRSVSEHLSQAQWTWERVRAAAGEVGFSLAPDPPQGFENVLDAEKLVGTRTGAGGAARAPMDEMIRRFAEEIHGLAAVNTYDHGAFVARLREQVATLAQSLRASHG